MLRSKQKFGLRKEIVRNVVKCKLEKPAELWSS